MKKTTTLIALSVVACTTMMHAAAGSVPDGQSTVAECLAKAPPSRSAVSLPFFTSFDDKSDFECWTSVNNNSYYTWEWYDCYWTEFGGCAYLVQKTGVRTESDNMLLSPGFSLSPGKTYRLEFNIMNWFESDLHVYLLDSFDAAAASKKELFVYQGKDWGVKRVEFEVPADGTYYVAWHDVTPWRENVTTLRYQVYVDDVRLEMISNNAVPASPGDLRPVPGINGEISRGLEWTNPVFSRQGERLDGLSRVVISRDGQIVSTIESGVTPGAKMSWTDPDPTPGKHKYSTVVSNTAGDAEPAVVETFVGIDVPGAPRNLSVDYDADGGIVTVDWENPEFGAKGGWFDKTGLRYRVVRQPGNKVLATDLRDEMIEDDDLSEYGNYTYQREFGIRIFNLQPS